MNRITEFTKSDKGKALATIAREHFTWPGGYRMWALMCDGGFICAECVSANYKLIISDTVQGRRGWAFTNAFTHWEGDPLVCDECGTEYAAEYSED